MPRGKGIASVTLFERLRRCATSLRWPVSYQSHSYSLRCRPASRNADSASVWRGSWFTKWQTALLSRVLTADALLID